MDKQNIYGGIKWAKVTENPERVKFAVEHMAKEDRKVGRKRSDHETLTKFDITNNSNFIFSYF